jgi:phosphoserine phosphatase
MEDNLIVVTILGKDKSGLVAGITKRLADVNINIVDIEQSVIRGLFSMFMLVDLGNSSVDLQGAKGILKECSGNLNVDITTTPFSEYEKRIEPKRRDIQTLTILGADKPGIVFRISQTLSDLGVNIERIKMIARGELLVMEMSVDPGAADVDNLREGLRGAGDTLGVDIVLQSESVSRRRKRLVVFDMDGTIVDSEIIDELARAAGVGKEVAELTERGMRGEVDFEESLKKRMAMLKGLPVSVLENIRDNMKLTPGTEELIRILKGMEFKLALISGGFTYFTDELKNTLGFDYAYANELVIKDGKLTGEVSGDIIDSKRKAEIVEELMKMENISKEEVVAVGDGANDRIMLKNAGLGIAFNAKDVLKKVADGSITKNNLKGLIYCLGADEGCVEGGG